MSLNKNIPIEKTTSYRCVFRCGMFFIWVLELRKIHHVGINVWSEIYITSVPIYLRFLTSSQLMYFRYDFKNFVGKELLHKTRKTYRFFNKQLYWNISEKYIATKFSPFSFEFVLRVFLHVFDMTTIFCFHVNVNNQMNVNKRICVSINKRI